MLILYWLAAKFIWWYLNAYGLYFGMYCPHITSSVIILVALAKMLIYSIFQYLRNFQYFFKKILVIHFWSSEISLWIFEIKNSVEKIINLMIWNFFSPHLNNLYSILKYYAECMLPQKSLRL